MQWLGTALTWLFIDTFTWLGECERRKSMDRKATLLAAFKGVNDRSPDAIMACWATGGVYDNPMVGRPAEGNEAVRQCMVNLCDGLAKSGQSLVVDRVTVGGHNVIAEWHVEPADGRRGVHVADFDEAGKLKRVTVYPRQG